MRCFRSLSLTAWGTNSSLWWQSPVLYIPNHPLHSHIRNILPITSLLFRMSHFFSWKQCYRFQAEIAFPPNQINSTNAVLVQNMPVWNGPVLLLAACFTLDTALPWVLNNTPAKCEVDRMNGCQDNRRKDRQTDRGSFHL